MQLVVVGSAEGLIERNKNVGGQIVQLPVSGVSGVPGASALPPVEEGHNLLQDMSRNKQQLGASSAMVQTPLLKSVIHILAILTIGITMMTMMMKRIMIVRMIV